MAARQANGETTGEGEGEGAEEDGVRIRNSDWIKYLDDEGTPYYYNVVTKETQWEAPVVEKPAPRPRPGLCCSTRPLRFELGV